MTTKDKILKVAKDLRIHDPQGGWFTKHQICGKNILGEFIPVGADNRIRDLVKEGILEHDDYKTDGRFMYYRFALPKVAVKALNYQCIVTAN